MLRLAHVARRTAVSSARVHARSKCRPDFAGGSQSDTYDSDVRPAGLLVPDGALRVCLHPLPLPSPCMMHTTRPAWEMDADEATRGERRHCRTLCGCRLHSCRPPLPRHASIALVVAVRACGMCTHIPMDQPAPLTMLAALCSHQTCMHRPRPPRLSASRCLPCLPP